MDPWIDAFCRWATAWAPSEDIARFASFQRALVGLMIIGPLCSTVGIQVVNFRLAFFSEAVGHSAFTGIAFGLLMSSVGVGVGIDPKYVMIVFGVAVGWLITYYRRSSGLPSDTVVGVFSSATVAFGLCVITYLIRHGEPNLGAQLNAFLLGNILTLDRTDIATLLVFLVVITVFEFFAYNRLMLLGVHPDLAQTMGIPVAVYEYAFASLVAAVVMFSIQAIGALLVTAALVVPAAAARNLAKTAGGVFWWGLVVSLTSSVGGFLLSLELDSATGASVVLCTMVWFHVGHLVAWLRGR